MSWWTEVIIATSSLENVADDGEPAVFPALDKLNKWCAENRHCALFVVSAPKAEMQCPDYIFVGMFKSLDQGAFVSEIKSCPWEWAEHVQLLVREEDDEGFHPVPL